MAHAFNPSTWEAEAGGSLEFEASLVHRVCSGQPGTTQRNPALEKKLPLSPEKGKKERKENCRSLCQAVVAKSKSEENPVSF